MKPWQTLLTEAIAADPRGRAGVAEMIGVSRATVSLLSSGNYPADPGPMSEKITSVYGRHHCPHLNTEISPRQCSQYANRRYPISNPREARHWRACQACPLKPEPEND
ncbi:MAG TPA: LacI family transcriptional regulator [Candidatus Tenderia sp.]|nr:LacI family transcriptional regulator [Candidatus Tenderia sp.]